jgi:8-oxo-dGTP pyrophosphatase MutT (NUDIX family)
MAITQRHNSHSTHAMKVSRTSSRYIPCQMSRIGLLGLFGIVLLGGAVYHWTFFYSSLGAPAQKFRGVQYWKEGATLGFQTVYESAFARFQIHQVLLEDGKTIVKDWLWFDESDNVNVLVEREADSKFLVLQQSKYGIMEARTYAVVGGLVEKDESPLQAAQRELQEELGMTAPEWVDLGNYRAAANRGGGTTFTFLAAKAKNNKITKRQTGMVAPGELERQDLIALTRDELVESVLSGKFREIKWTATVALALLRTL